MGQRDAHAHLQMMMRHVDVWDVLALQKPLFLGIYIVHT